MLALCLAGCAMRLGGGTVSTEFARGRPAPRQVLREIALFALHRGFTPDFLSASSPLDNGQPIGRTEFYVRQVPTATGQPASEIHLAITSWDEIPKVTLRCEGASNPSQRGSARDFLDALQREFAKRYGAAAVRIDLD